MRCLSPHAGYSIQVIEGQEQVVVDARGFANTVQLHKPVIADFQQGGLLDHEIEAALEQFNFSGIPEGVNPLTRISSFDTEAYVERFPANQKDELLVQIDQRLRDLQKINPNQFIVVEQPYAERPWPSYDQDSAEDILKFQERLRINPELIRRYEVENKNRQTLVLAMLKKEDPDGADAYAEEHGFGVDPEPVVKSKSKKAEDEVIEVAS